MYRRAWIRASLASAAALSLAACAKRKKPIASAKVSTPHRPPASPPAPAPIGSSETGIASWYGYPYHGRMAADGEIYDMEQMTAAHRTLPFQTWVRVTNLSNGKATDVRITDRGPFIAGRIIDLSHAAAREIDLIGPGIADVRLEVITGPATALAAAGPRSRPVTPPPAAVPSSSLFTVQVAILPDRARAEQMRDSLAVRYGFARLVLKDGAPQRWRVLVGKESTIEAAGDLARKLQADVGSAFIVRFDEVPELIGTF